MDKIIISNCNPNGILTQKEELIRLFKNNKLDAV
jgi:hypothetical protein